jgi:hypothetical protein
MLDILHHAAVIASFMRLALAPRELAREAHVDGKTRRFAAVALQVALALVVQAILLVWVAGSQPRIATADVAALVDLRRHAVWTTVQVGLLGLQVAGLLAVAGCLLRAMAAAALEQRLDLAGRRQVADAAK